MGLILPDAARFETAVYGTVFGNRRSAVERLEVGTRVMLVPDPPGVEAPSVWVHAPGGDVVGHLAPDVTRWLVPRMLDGVRYRATVHTVAPEDTESWKRLIITVERITP